MIAIRCKICNGTGKLLFDPKCPLKPINRRKPEMHKCDKCEDGVVVLWRKETAA